MTFDDQLKRAFDTLTDRVRDELDRQVRAATEELSASARIEAEVAAALAVAALPTPPPPAPQQDAPPEPMSVPGPPAADQRLLEGVRAIDAARSLTSVLDALVGAAAHDGIGAGVWLVRSGHLRYWRSAGMPAPPGDMSLEPHHGAAPAEHHPAIVDAARSNSASSRGGFAVPLAVSGQVVAVLFASAIDAASSASVDLDATDQVRVEILARYAARCLESTTAFTTARAIADRAASAENQPREPESSTDAAAHADDQSAAQRYARLLVSEIRLYHESDVLEGRRGRDLATRLGGEIARARAMYEQRVPPHERRHDYFHDELVRTLADGDGSLLVNS